MTQANIDKINKLIEELKEDYVNLAIAQYNRGYADAMKEQEPKTGEWIEHFDESGKWYECDQCHTDWGGPVNFCPDCGAKMGESEVDNGNDD